MGEYLCFLLPPSFSNENVFETTLNASTWALILKESVWFQMFFLLTVAVLPSAPRGEGGGRGGGKAVVYSRALTDVKIPRDISYEWAEKFRNISQILQESRFCFVSWRTQEIRAPALVRRMRRRKIMGATRLYSQTALNTLLITVCNFIAIVVRK